MTITNGLTITSRMCWVALTLDTWGLFSSSCYAVYVLLHKEENIRFLHTGMFSNIYQETQELLTVFLYGFLETYLVPFIFL